MEDNMDTKKKILIVEDEESIAELEKDYLEINGFEVVIETEGTSALKRTDEEEFDMFILDLMLPGIDGLICSKFLPVLIIHLKLPRSLRRQKNYPVLPGRLPGFCFPQR